MTQNELEARVVKAAKAGFIQSLNNLGYSEGQIKEAAAHYPAALEKRASDRYELVRGLILNAINN